MIAFPSGQYVYDSRRRSELAAGTATCKVNEFLKRFKARMTASDLVFIQRKPSLDAIALLGLTVDEGESIILDLTEMDYSSGPDRDDGNSGETWTFVAAAARRSICVKLKLDGEKAICVSFHSLDFGMKRLEGDGV
jgi:hypothetical protein